MIPLLDFVPLAAGKLPLMIEVPVPPESGPYLVTSSKAVTWREAPFSGGFVRAVVRQVQPNLLFAELLEAVMAASETYGWGSVVASVGEAEARMQEYDFSEYDVLDHENAPWLPASVRFAIVPTDRAYVGTVFVADDSAAAVVHNPSRGICIVRPHENMVA